MFHNFIFLILVVSSCYSYQPNVLFIILDDFKPALSIYGDRMAYTPNIDNLASKSFVFHQAYAQQALCAPSRNSFLTSRRPDSLHLYDFYSYWRVAVGNYTTMPQYFKDRGYHTHSVGKVFHPGISSNFSDDQPYSWSQQPFHPVTEKYKNAKVCPNLDGSWSKNLICPVITQSQPLETLPDIESKNEAVRFLSNFPENGKPFFLALGFHKPHIPFKFPQSFLGFHPLCNISLPSNNKKPPTLPEVAWNPWIDIRERDDIAKLNISFPFGPVSDEINRNIIQAYYASVTYVDQLIGKVLKEVNLNNTIIVLTGDHGWSLGQHGEFSKYSNYKEVTRVPLLIYIPHLSNQQVTVKALVELVDLFPTLVDLTQVSEPLKQCPVKGMVNTCTEGASLVPVMLEAVEEKNYKTTKKVKGKSAIFTQYPRPGLAPSLHPNSDRPHLKDIKIMGYSITTKKFRYCEWVGFNHSNFTANWSQVYAKEFYDHRIDPEENLNLSDRNEFSGLMKVLRKKLIKGWRYA